MVDKFLPHLGIDRRILDRGIGEDDRVGIVPLAWIGRQVGHQVSVAVAILLVQGPARAFRGLDGWSDKKGHPLPPSRQQVTIGVFSTAT